MSADERVLSEAVDGVEVDVVVPPDHAPLARQTLAYGLSGLIVPLVGMITLPVFARVFTRSEYGLLELGTTTLIVAAAITDAGLTAAALRNFYDYTAEQEAERRSVMLTGFLATTVIALAVALLMIGFRDEISRWIFGEGNQGTLVILIACSVPALNTMRYLGEVMRVRFQAFSYLTMSALAAAVTTGLGVAGVLAFDWNVNGVFVAAVAGNALAAAYGLLAVWRWLKGRFSRPELRSMLGYGLPLVPNALAAWALALVDRIILSRLGSLSEVGQYAVANRLALILLIGMTAFLFALSPFLLATYAEDPEQEKAARGRTLTYLTFVLAFVGLSLTLFAKEIFDLVAPRFDDAYLAVGPLALGGALYGISTLLTTGLSIARKTVHLAALTIVAAILNVALNFALIPPFGIVGAGLATAAGYGALALSYYWLAQRLYSTPYEPSKVLTMLAAASLLGLLGLVPFGLLGVAVAVKLAAVAAFVGVARLTGAMTGSEFRELRRFAHSMAPRVRDNAGAA
jgi:O-antigen/teichoic acid export membrane protein